MRPRCQLNPCHTRDVDPVRHPALCPVGLSGPHGPARARLAGGVADRLCLAVAHGDAGAGRSARARPRPGGLHQQRPAHPGPRWIAGSGCRCGRPAGRRAPGTRKPGGRPLPAVPVVARWPGTATSHRFFCSDTATVACTAMASTCGTSERRPPARCRATRPALPSLTPPAPPSA